MDLTKKQVAGFKEACVHINKKLLDANIALDKFYSGDKYSKIRADKYHYSVNEMVKIMDYVLSGFDYELYYDPIINGYGIQKRRKTNV